jgi:thioredoxin 1
MAERISGADFSEKALGAGLNLIDFYSDSCVPCKRMSPVLAELEEERAGQVKVYKVNIAYETDLVEQYGVRSAPTFVLFKDGAEVARLNGVVKKADLESLIEQNQ